jgi:putative phosphoribosyl transferase
MSELATAVFADRHAAGRALGARLHSFAGEDPVVLGLARGGVPVAYEVAQQLRAPLDVLVVRKIGAPGNPEYGIGAVAEGDVRVLNWDAVRRLLVSADELETAIRQAQAEIDVGVQRYRGARRPREVRGRTAIVVDDGLATGGTARAALRAVRARDPRRLVLAIPVGAPDSVESLRAEADDVVCLFEPETLWAVGLWYDHFEPTSDAEIAKLLAGGAHDPPRPPMSPAKVRIPLEHGGELVGDLALPAAAAALVVFAHGSGSSRHSARNRQVARWLNERRFATLLLDLLTMEEELDRANVFDIGLLAHRLVAATEWKRGQPALAALSTGYFGASTGAGAALWAAADLGDEVGAVVSRGGRPDLAVARLREVRAPVLLIVGGHDEIVLELNREARSLMRATSELSVVAGATHLFEEPGALAEVSRLASAWFERHFVHGRGSAGSPGSPRAQ